MSKLDPKIGYFQQSQKSFFEYATGFRKVGREK